MPTSDGDRPLPDPPSPQPTGRTLVLFRRGADLSTVGTRIDKTVGIKTLDVREFATAPAEMGTTIDKGSAVFVPRFRVAVLPATVSARAAVLNTADDVEQARPEFYMFAIGAPPFADTDQFTWGLIATGADRSAYGGRGIRVAVLDTGLDLEHPDFKGRNIVGVSFVGGSVQDVQGHGTHTAGTVAGPRKPITGRRYGVAPDVDLYIGKVLNDNGSGREGDIINGINWAIDEKCVAISMSLGRPTFPGAQHDPFYEEAGSAALADGSLIIAAAGNESARDYGYIAPVSAPANAPSIMAVAAVDPKLAVAPFSCGGINSGGGEVEIAGPGVSVYSAVPRPQLYRTLQGTSMACPHVAGIAALWAESNAALRGQRLREALLRSARALGNPRDFGAGLVQAPSPVVA
jgi:subtilisin